MDADHVHDEEDASRDNNPGDAGSTDPDNGNIAVETLLEDDDSYLSPDNQSISRKLRALTPEQFRRTRRETNDDCSSSSS